VGGFFLSRVSKRHTTPEIRIIAMIISISGFMLFSSSARSMVTMTAPIMTQIRSTSSAARMVMSRLMVIITVPWAISCGEAHAMKVTIP